jgi:hypothetical protein
MGDLWLEGSLEQTCRSPHNKPDAFDLAGSHRLPPLPLAQRSLLRSPAPSPPLVGARRS